MKYSLILLILISSNFIVKGQTDREKIESFNYAINRQFTKIVTGNTFSNLGNFASLSSDSKTIGVGINIVKEKNIYGVEISGGAEEGILKIFSGFNLNSNITGEFKYHRLLKVKQASRNLLTSEEVNLEIVELIANIEANNRDNNLKLKNKGDINNEEINKLKNDIYNIEFKISQYNDENNQRKLILQAPQGRYNKDSIRIVIDYINKNIETEQNSINTINAKIIYIQNNPDFISSKKNVETLIKINKLLDLEKKKKNISLNSIDISWFSFGYRVKNNEFTLYIPNTLQGSLFSDTSFVSQRLAFSISNYKWSKEHKNDAFKNFGIFIDYTTNINTLKKLEFEERIPNILNPQLFKVKKINAYEGNFKDGLLDLTVYYDYIRYFNWENSLVAFHFNPSINYNKIINKPSTNIIVGLIFSINDNKNEESKVNFELFYNKLDLFNYIKNQTKSGTLGIRATIPISPN